MNKNIWNNYDAIYCIHFLPHKQRFQPIKEQFKKVGILQNKNFHWKYTIESPYQKIFRDSVINKIKSKTLLKRLGAFNCTYAHYQILKEMIEFNYERILVFQNDVVFLSDLNKLQNIILNSPFNYDLIKYESTIIDNQLKSDIIKNTHKINNYFNQFKQQNLLSAGSYSINRNGAKKVIQLMQKEWYVIDVNFVVLQNISKCFSISNCTVQRTPEYRQLYGFYDFKDYNF